MYSRRLPAPTTLATLQVVCCMPMQAGSGARGGHFGGGPCTLRRQRRAARCASNCPLRGCLAQLVERRPYKANVGGSSPSAPTNSIRRSARPAKGAVNTGDLKRDFRIPGLSERVGDNPENLTRDVRIPGLGRCMPLRRSDDNAVRLSLRRRRIAAGAGRISRLRRSRRGSAG